jgi:hypothetical protein
MSDNSACFGVQMLAQYQESERFVFSRFRGPVPFLGVHLLAPVRGMSNNSNCFAVLKWWLSIKNTRDLFCVPVPANLEIFMES